MTHEWVETGYVLGFVTGDGVVLDLDNMTLKTADRIAQDIMNEFHLEGYLLVKSSKYNWHVIFNRKPVDWRTITQAILYDYRAVRWAVMQVKKGYEVIRVSTKNNKNFPEIVNKVGDCEDGLVDDYLDVRNIASKVEDWKKDIEDN